MHDIGDTWVNLISGLEYRWDGEFWRSTGRFPHGPDPMGFISEGGISHEAAEMFPSKKDKKEKKPCT
jgi:hypothetical protein